MILNKQLVKNVNKNVSKKKTAVEKKHLKNTFLELQCLSATIPALQKNLKKFLHHLFSMIESKKKQKNIYL